MRVFIALELPPEVVRQAARLTGAVDLLRTAGVSTTKLADLHLTVKYVGEANRRTVEGLCDALQRTARDAEPVELAFGDVGGFLSLESPEVIYLAVNCPDGGLLDLRSMLVDQLVGLRVRADDFDYTPHVTVAKLEGAAPDDVAAVSARAANANRRQLGRLRFRCGSRALYSSVRDPRGVTRYEPICRAELGGTR